MMQEINPSVKESILKTAEHLDDAASIYKIGIEEAKLRVKTSEGISINALKQEAASETVLFEILHPLGFNAAQVRDICRTLDGQPGKVFTTPGWRVIKDRGSLLIELISEILRRLMRSLSNNVGSNEELSINRFSTRITIRSISTDRRRKADFFHETKVLRESLWKKRLRL